MSNRSAACSGGAALPESQSLNALLSCLNDQLGVALVLVNIETHRLVWTSDASAKLDNRLIAGNSLKDLPELLPVLQEALQSRFFQDRKQSRDTSWFHTANEVAADVAGKKTLSVKAQKFEEQLNSLTPREAEVLEHLLQGLANKQCAYELQISVRTVELHRARLLKKLCVRSGAELIRAVLIHRAGQ